MLLAGGPAFVSLSYADSKRQAARPISYFYTYISRLAVAKYIRWVLKHKALGTQRQGTLLASNNGVVALLARNGVLLHASPDGRREIKRCLKKCDFTPQNNSCRRLRTSSPSSSSKTGPVPCSSRSQYSRIMGCGGENMVIRVLFCGVCLKLKVWRSKGTFPTFGEALLYRDVFLPKFSETYRCAAPPCALQCRVPRCSVLPTAWK